MFCLALEFLRVFRYFAFKCWEKQNLFEFWNCFVGVLFICRYSNIH